MEVTAKVPCVLQVKSVSRLSKRNQELTYESRKRQSIPKSCHGCFEIRRMEVLVNPLSLHRGVHICPYQWDLFHSGWMSTSSLNQLVGGKGHTALRGIPPPSSVILMVISSVPSTTMTLIAGRAFSFSAPKRSTIARREFLSSSKRIWDLFL